MFFQRNEGLTIFDLKIIKVEHINILMKLHFPEVRCPEKEFKMKILHQGDTVFKGKYLTF